MKHILACVALLAAASVSAEPIASAPTALGGWIILKTDHCDAPMRAWHQYAVTSADGIVVTSGCYYLSSDGQRVVAREGSTLEPIEWPAEVFHVIPENMRNKIQVTR